jgi:hypothetical protein
MAPFAALPRALARMRLGVQLSPDHSNAAQIPPLASVEKDVASQNSALTCRLSVGSFDSLNTGSPKKLKGAKK